MFLFPNNSLSFTSIKGEHRDIVRNKTSTESYVLKVIDFQYNKQLISLE